MAKECSLLPVASCTLVLQRQPPVVQFVPSLEFLVIRVLDSIEVTLDGFEHVLAGLHYDSLGDVAHVAQSVLLLSVLDHVLSDMV